MRSGNRYGLSRFGRFEPKPLQKTRGLTQLGSETVTNWPVVAQTVTVSVR